MSMFLSRCFLITMLTTIPYSLQFLDHSIFTCDFDRPVVGWEACDFTLESDVNGFTWVLQNYSTGSQDTGPDFDHTFMNTTNGYYMFTEVSDFDAGSIAKLWTPSLLYSGNDRCLTFWYNMYGQHMGTLSVVQKGSSGSPEVLWKLSGNQNDPWYFVNVTVPYDVDKLAFVGSKDTYDENQPYGDMAIDDVVIYDGSCDNMTRSTAATTTTAPTTTTTATTTNMPTTTTLAPTTPNTTSFTISQTPTSATPTSSNHFSTTVAQTVPSSSGQPIPTSTTPTPPPQTSTIPTPNMTSSSSAISQTPTSSTPVPSTPASSSAASTPVTSPTTVSSQINTSTSSEISPNTTAVASSSTPLPSAPMTSSGQPIPSSTTNMLTSPQTSSAPSTPAMTSFGISHTSTSSSTTISSTSTSDVSSTMTSTSTTDQSTMTSSGISITPLPTDMTSSGPPIPSSATLISQPQTSMTSSALATSGNSPGITDVTSTMTQQTSTMTSFGRTLSFVTSSPSSAASELPNPSQTMTSTVVSDSSSSTSTTTPVDGGVTPGNDRPSVEPGSGSESEGRVWGLDSTDFSILIAILAAALLLTLVALAVAGCHICLMRRRYNVTADKELAVLPSYPTAPSPIPQPPPPPQTTMTFEGNYYARLPRVKDPTPDGQSTDDSDVSRQQLQDKDESRRPSREEVASESGIGDGEWPQGTPRSSGGGGPGVDGKHAHHMNYYNAI